MCGKFTQRDSSKLTWQELHDELGLIGGEGGARPQTVTPMRFANIIRLNASGAREVVPMRWGFSALSAQNPAKPDHIHARAETIDSKPTFRVAFRERRGILAVHDFNEAEEITPTRTLQYVVTPPPEEMPLGIAILWEAWENPEHGELLTFVMVTTAANALIAKITDRMPAILTQKDWPLWLGETAATAGELKAILKPHEGVAWTMAPEKKPPPPKKPTSQGELF